MIEHDWLDDCVSVDIEAAGPYPGAYALLSIGACLISNPLQTFYAELQPDRSAFQKQALEISGFTLEELGTTGLPAANAIDSFALWLDEVVPGEPIFVAFNAPFDWMFVNDYFHRYYGSNPFGHTAIDIKALFLGLSGDPWTSTSMDLINQSLGFDKALSHHALEDALDQAKLFLEIIRRLRAAPLKE